MTQPVVVLANYGLQLVDELTGAGLVGTSEVSAELLSMPVAGDETNLTPYLVGRSRWVFERLSVDVRFTIRADGYLTRVETTGVDLPAIPGVAPGLLAEVTMKPTAGYPFAPSLTRIVGRVVTPELDGAPPVPGAMIEVTPVYSGVDGAVFTTTADENGQYAGWFLPDTTQSPTMPTQYKVHADATIDIGGVPTAVSGDIGPLDLTLYTFNGAPKLELTV